MNNASLWSEKKRMYLFQQNPAYKNMKQKTRIIVSMTSEEYLLWVERRNADADRAERVRAGLEPDMGEF